MHCLVFFSDPIILTFILPFCARSLDSRFFFFAVLNDFPSTCTPSSASFILRICARESRPPRHSLTGCRPADARHAVSRQATFRVFARGACKVASRFSNGIKRPLLLLVLLSDTYEYGYLVFARTGNLSSRVRYSLSQSAFVFRLPKPRVSCHPSVLVTKTPSTTLVRRLSSSGCSCLCVSQTGINRPLHLRLTPASRVLPLYFPP